MRNILNTWLNAPIPRKNALVVVIGQGVLMNVVSVLAIKKTADQANLKLADQNERLAIFSETLDFLIDNADDTTLLKLNENLDYWRVVRGMPPRDED